MTKHSHVISLYSEASNVDLLFLLFQVSVQKEMKKLKVNENLEMKMAISDIKQKGKCLLYAIYLSWKNKKIGYIRKEGYVTHLLINLFLFKTYKKPISNISTEKYYGNFIPASAD